MTSVPANSEPQRAHPPCWGCGSSAWRPLFTIRGYDYVACTLCGLARLDPVPSADEAAGHYGEGYFRAAAAAGPTGGYRDYGVDADLHRRNGRDRLRLLAAVGLPPGPVLDVGCAHGYFLDEVRRAGRPIVGVEPSPFARAEAELLLGQPVHASLVDVAAAPVMAAVTFFQVLEHTVDPGAAVRAAVERLQPGGLLAVETWDRASLVARASGRRWSQLTPPSVVTLLDRSSAGRLLAGAGLRVEQVRRTSKVVSLGLVAGLVAEKAPRLAPVADAVTGRPSLAGAGVRYALGDVITLVARVPEATTAAPRGR